MHRRALNYVEVEVLSRESLEEVIAEFPSERPRIMWWRVFYAVQRIAKAVAAEEKLELEELHSAEIILIF